MIHCNEDLQVQMYRLKVILCESLDHTIASMPKLCFSFKSYFILGGKLQGQRADLKGQGDAWDRDT